MEPRNNMCFVCGEDNPIGLHLVFHDEGGVSTAQYVAKPEHQGYRNILHGGLMSTLLDEIMARPLNAQGINAVTAKMEIRFRQAVPIGTTLTARGELVNKRGRLYEMKGQLTREDGEVVAEATGTFMQVK